MDSIINIIFKKMKRIKLRWWIMLGIVGFIFLRITAYHLELAQVATDAKTYLTVTYKEPFTITGVGKETWMYYRYEISATANRYPNDTITIYRSLGTPGEYEDDYTYIKLTHQSQDIVQPTLKEYIVEPGWGFVDIQYGLLSSTDNKQSNERTRNESPYIHVDIVYLINKNEKEKYMSKVKNMIQVLNKKRVTQTSFTIYFYNKTQYKSLQHFKEQLQEAGHPVTLAAQSGKALLSEETFDIGLSDK